MGPKVAKVDIKLGGINLSPFSGKGEISGLVVGNPEGFKAPNAIKIGSATVAMKPSSLLSDKIVIRSVTIQAAEITFEGALGGNNNLSKIMANVEAATGGSKPAAADEKKTAPKLEVDDFVITGGIVHVSLILMGGKSATVRLPDIHLTDMGTGPEGITPAEFSKQVLQAITHGTVKAVAGAMADLGKGATDTAKSIGKGATDGAGKAAKSITDIFKKK